MINNENILIKDYPQIKNEKYKTPKWVGWFNIIYLLLAIPITFYLASKLYEIIYFTTQQFSKDWASGLADQTKIVIALLCMPAMYVVMMVFKYLNDNFFIKELFTGATDYIIPYQNDEIDLKSVFDIKAKSIPPNTKIFIHLYNKQQEVKLTKRRHQGYKKEIRITIDEAKAYGVDLDVAKYPVLSIKRNKNKQIGNVSLYETIKIPPSEQSIKIEELLPQNIHLEKSDPKLMKPSLHENILTEIGIRVTLYSENEDFTYFEMFLNPMETAFCVEV